MTDERRLDAVEQLIPSPKRRAVADAHGDGLRDGAPRRDLGDLGPRTMEQLDDLLAGAEVVLADEVLDRIDAIVAPGNRRRTARASYNPPAILEATFAADRQPSARLLDGRARSASETARTPTRISDGSDLGRTHRDGAADPTLADAGCRMSQPLVIGISSANDRS